MARVEQAALGAARPVVPGAVVEEVTAALREALLAGGPVSTAAVRAAVAACPDAPRRRELGAFVQALEPLTSAERILFAESLHPVQVPSKLWLVDELAELVDLANATLVVLGAWYGILPVLLEWRLEAAPRRVVCVDLDESVCEVGDRIVGPLYERVEFLCADAITLDYGAYARNPSLVLVNTICEHLPDVRGWWSRVPAGQLTVLQSNNWAGCPDHVNAVTSVDELKAQTPLGTILFEGVLRLPQLERYMLIGRR